MLSAYARFIVQYSYLILITISVIGTVLTAIPLLCRDFPTFSDPIVGFETRGTKLAGRFIAWENLIEETRPSKRLAVDPQEIEDQIRMNQSHSNKIRHEKSGPVKQAKKKGRKKKKKAKNYNNTVIENHNITDTENYNNTVAENYNNTGILKIWPDELESNEFSNHEHWGFGRNITYEDETIEYLRNHTRNQWISLKNMQQNRVSPVFPNYASGSCGAPLPNYAHLVVTGTDNTSLLSFENVQNLCKFQSYLVDLGDEEYYKLCQRTTNSEEMCCPVWSVPNYIALMSGKNSCENLTIGDVNKSIRIIKKCAGYFHNFTLMSSCELNRCKVPRYCSQYDAIYNLLFYLIDSESFAPPKYSNIFVKNVMIFFPLPASSTVLNYYYKLQSSNLSYKTLIIPAMDFGLKNTLFDKWVIQDTWLIGLGGLFVFACVWFYTKSLVLTLLLFTAIAYSLGIAYFLYVYLFNLEFFPFMNLLVIVIVIGIGADDAFLYVKFWKMISKQLMKDNVVNQENELAEIKNVSSAGETILVQIIEETLKHSFLPILVTSLTTAVAFFASYVSYIPAINCFSVFAGVAVLVNFFLMMTWLPVSVFIVDVKLCTSKIKLMEMLQKIVNEVWEDIRVILNRFIVTSVTKLHIVFVLTLGAIGICSIVVVFYMPGLKLPDSNNFQLFQSTHPFEQYDSSYKSKFLFERFSKDSTVGLKMPLRWVWGVKAIDNGNHMDPSSTGHLVFDEKFSISHPESQVWLLQFCRKIKTQPFYQHTVGPLLPNCFIETFKMFMDRKCVDIVEIDRSPCCETSQFPYKEEVFNFCIIKAMKSLYQTPREMFMPGVAGPKFYRNAKPTIAAVVVEYESVVPYSMSVSDMDTFYIHVDNWTRHELRSAPQGMKGGWFLSDLQFYDLQKTLADGTVMALTLSAGLGFIILIPSTLSFIVSICALSAMIFSSTVTIAILVLNNWKLNVLESVAISTSTGLAVDFSLHYALSYTNICGSKLVRVKSALTTTAGPTAAAALTTGFSGIFLLRSNLLPYWQIGTFLALIMSVSWVYATFFLCSLLYIFGRANSNELSNEDRKSVSRVSSVCSGVPNLESHELEHLADSNRTNLTHSHSPSSVSATTVVIHDDFENSHSKSDKRSSITST